MSRPTRYKLGYAAIVAVLATVGVGLWIRYPRPAVLGGMVVALLIPGRLQGWLWRDFFRGRRALGEGRAGDAIPYLERFLARVRSRPGLKSAIWLAWAVYTRDVEAMTRNNLGVAKLLMNLVDEARVEFEEALRIDPLYPLAHAGLAQVATVLQNPEAAATHAARAVELGFARTRVDLLLQSMSGAYARMEGRPPGGASSPS